MDNNKFLPVGTVVRLKEGKKNIVISGFCPISKEDNKMYDYCAFLYPEGMIAPEINFLFNHDQIEQILFKGFVTEEEVAFKAKLNNFLAQSGNQMNNSIPSQLVQNQNAQVQNQNPQVQNQNIIQPQFFNNVNNQENNQ